MRLCIFFLRYTSETIYICEHYCWPHNIIQYTINVIFSTHITNDDTDLNFTLPNYIRTYVQFWNLFIGLHRPTYVWHWYERLRYFSSVRQQYVTSKLWFTEELMYYLLIKLWLTLDSDWYLIWSKILAIINSLYWTHVHMHVFFSSYEFNEQPNHTIFIH